MSFFRKIKTWHIVLATIAMLTSSCQKEDGNFLVNLYLAPVDTLAVGDATTVQIVYVPENADSGLPFGKQHWTSSDTSIVRIDQSGNIQAIDIGQVTVRLMWGGFKAETTVSVDETFAFKSRSFADYCLARYDANHDGILQSSEVYTVVGLDLTDLSVELEPISLAGIESFVNLQKLKITHLKISELDLSKNKRLSDLDCSQSELTRLDVSRNKNLQNLDCHGCPNLTELVFGSKAEYGENALVILNCYRCSITGLDLSRCTHLEYIDCRDNRLTSLDLTNSPKMTQIWCSGNEVAAPTLPADFEMEQLKEHDF